MGIGLADFSVALMLSTYGTRNMLFTKYRSLAATPRAHITNQRTMEILRDLDVEPKVTVQATPQVDNAVATEVAHKLIGNRSIPIEVTSTVHLDGEPHIRHALRTGAGLLHGAMRCTAIHQGDGRGLGADQQAGRCADRGVRDRPGPSL